MKARPRCRVAMQACGTGIAGPGCSRRSARSRRNSRNFCHDAGRGRVRTRPRGASAAERHGRCRGDCRSGLSSESKRVRASGSDDPGDRSKSQNALGRTPAAGTAGPRQDLRAAGHPGRAAAPGDQQPAGSAAGLRDSRRPARPGPDHVAALPGASRRPVRADHGARRTDAGGKQANPAVRRAPEDAGSRPGDGDGRCCLRPADGRLRARPRFPGMARPAGTAFERGTAKAGPNRQLRRQSIIGAMAVFSGTKARLLAAIALARSERSSAKGPSGLRPARMLWAIIAKDEEFRCGPQLGHRCAWGTAPTMREKPKRAKDRFRSGGFGSKTRPATFEAVRHRTPSWGALTPDLAATMAQDGQIGPPLDKAAMREPPLTGAIGPNADADGGEPDCGGHGAQSPDRRSLWIIRMECPGRGSRSAFPMCHVLSGAGAKAWPPFRSGRPVPPGADGGTCSFMHRTPVASRVFCNPG